MMDNHTQHQVETGRMAIGAVLAGITAITLNEWVAIVTILYFVINIFIALPKAVAAFRSLFGKK